MKTLRGKSTGHFKPIIGIASAGRPFYDRANYIYVGAKQGIETLGYAGIVISGERGGVFQPDGVTNVNDIDIINNGDILRITEDGRAAIVWDINSSQNAFLLTESCNCKCLMCPQPPKRHDPNLLVDAENILTLLKGKKIECICITGGEPTLTGDLFFSFLSRCVTEHPESEIDILTNGKTFSHLDFVRKISSISTANVLFCVSLHSDIPYIHDKIVDNEGSFEKTENGIYNLAMCGLNIEIRHVVTKLNFKRLLSFAQHIYNYFPFCNHYAIMGMEFTGFAELNMNNIGISPHEYKDELTDTILYLNRRGMPVSIYNIPLCLCDDRVRCFARSSISSWKNTFLPECKGCSRKTECAGFFSTSAVLPREHIHPI